MQIKKVLSRLAKLFLAFIAGIVLLEVGLRTLYSPTFEFHGLFEFDRHRLIKLKPGAEADPWRDNNVTVFEKDDVETYNVNINGQGLRADTHYSTTPAPNTLRIMCLGDSITFGWGLEREYSYPALLEVYLSRLYGQAGVEVINAGCPGYTSRQGLIWFDRKLVEFRPHMIIVQYGYNDSLHTRLAYPLPFQNMTDNEMMEGSPGQWRPIDRSLVFSLGYYLNKSLIVKTVKFAFSSLEMSRNVLAVSGKLEEERGQEKSVGRSERKSRVGLKEYEENMRAFVRLCKDKSIRVVFIDPWPTKLQYRNVLRRLADETGAALVSQFNVVERVRLDPEIVTERRSFGPLVDKVLTRKGSQKLEKQPEFYVLFDDYVHPNEIGNILFVEELIANLSLKKDDPTP